MVSANRVWNKADKYALAEFTETLRSKPRLILNGVSPDFIDQVLGEIEKSRSALRKFLKGLVTMQFKSRKFKSAKPERNTSEIS
ncbi:MAG: hypothetical protein U5L96_03425 [Owenweeksia sp.]|nr:hypothetical protein [Owenweeksia sp.]